MKITYGDQYFVWKIVLSFVYVLSTYLVLGEIFSYSLTWLNFDVVFRWNLVEKIAFG